MKKSQIKMTESIAVLFVFFILLGFSLVFFTKFQATTIKATQREFTSLRAVDVSQTASLLPEIICSHNSVITTYCFDEEKVHAFRDNWNNTAEQKQQYTALLGTSEIFIEEIWPYDNSPSLVVYNNSRSGNYTRLSTKIPILLYKPTKPRTEDFVYAVLNVNLYARVI